MLEVAAIVLAAGRASRFARAGEGAGASKVFALLDGTPLVAHVVASAAAARSRPIVVVTGRSAELAEAALRKFAVTLVHNHAFAEGMASSIVAGLAAVPTAAAGALILLADMPRVSPSTLVALIETFDRERPDAVVPCHQGRRGNPVLVSRSLFPALGRLRGDVGARLILADGSARVTACDVDDPGVLIDVDTREALDALSAARDQDEGEPS